MRKNVIIPAFAAALALVSCVKTNELPAPVETRTVSFHAVSPDTKAVFTAPEGNQYPVLWTANDTKVYVVQNYKKVADGADLTISADNKTATFEAELAKGAEENGVIAVVPAGAVKSVNSTNKTLNIEIPAAQTSSSKSPDEAAMILYAKESLGGTIPSDVDLTFQHFSAYFHLSFSNYEDALSAAGATVQAVSITSEKEIAGRAFFSEDGTISPNAMFKTVTVSTTSLSDVWVGLTPVDLSGETLTLVVNTDKGTMTKKITFPAGRNLTSGKVANIPVDMTGISIVAPVVYKLVTSVSQLHVGDKIIVAAANYDVALSTTQNENNRAAAGVSKGEGVIRDPSAAVEKITLEDGVKPGEYAMKASAGYLYAASLATGDKNYLRTAAPAAVTPELARFGSWDISIFDTVQKDNNSEKTETSNAAKVIVKDASRGLLRYNGSGSNNLFSAYEGNHATTYLIHLYRLDVPADETARFKVTMPDANDAGAVSVPAAGKELEVYIFGNTPWTASVTGGATLSSASGNGNAILTLTVPENTSTTDTPSYTVTVKTTATVAKDTYTFTVNQVAAPSGGAPKVGDVLWAENWVGAKKNDTPAAYQGSATASTTVYGGTSVTYSSYDNTSTKMYTDGLVFLVNNKGTQSPSTYLSSDEINNLLVQKEGGWFKVTGIPCSGVKKALLTYKSNTSLEDPNTHVGRDITVTSDDEKITLSPLNATSKTNEYTYNSTTQKKTYYEITCEITFGDGFTGDSFNLTFNNGYSANIRLTQFEVKVTE